MVEIGITQIMALGIHTDHVIRHKEYETTMRPSGPRARVALPRVEHLILPRVERLIYHCVYITFSFLMYYNKPRVILLFEALNGFI
jgi:hypothetical protein